MNLKFKPLSEKYFSEAISLIEKVFPEDKEHVKKAYDVSIKNDKKDEWWKTRNILEYWVVVDIDLNKIVALTGFYQMQKHSKDEIWLGWYCVDPLSRNKGIGRKTLEWTISEARKRGYKLFRLWTTTSPNEATAQKLYDKLDLNIYNKEFDDSTGETILYRELKL